MVARRSAFSVGTFKFQVLQRAHVSDDLSILRSFCHVCYQTREGLVTANRRGIPWDFSHVLGVLTLALFDVQVRDAWRAWRQLLKLQRTRRHRSCLMFMLRWHDYGLKRRRSRYVVGKFAQKMETVIKIQVMSSWLSTALKRKSLRRVCVKFAMRCQQMAMSPAFLRWLQSCNASARCTQVSRRIVSRMQNRCVTSALLKWRQDYLEASRCREVSRRIVTRWRNRCVTLALLNWLDYCSENLRKRRMADRAGGCSILAAHFDVWAHAMIQSCFVRAQARLRSFYDIWLARRGCRPYSQAARDVPPVALHDAREAMYETGTGNPTANSGNSISLATSPTRSDKRGALTKDGHFRTFSRSGSPNRKAHFAVSTDVPVGPGERKRTRSPHLSGSSNLSGSSPLIGSPLALHSARGRENHNRRASDNSSPAVRTHASSHVAKEWR